MEFKIGTRKGYLTIIDIYKNSKNRTEINCRCVCGNFHKTLLSYFKAGRCNSCKLCSKIRRKIGVKNFYNLQDYTKHHNFNGYKEIPLSFFSAIKRNAQRRNIEFDIKIKYLYELFISQNRKCYFTDIKLVLSGKNCNASVDRINSNIGYIEGNIIWVYKPINTMKSDIKIDKFIELCCMIADNI